VQCITKIEKNPYLVLNKHKVLQKGLKSSQK
jgi:hypothetical protein